MAEHRIFGIRHHGPGSARSLLAALEAWKPDRVLIEGPPEADALLEWVGNEGLVPPVALLSHAEDDPSRAVFHPFAAFSPEWVALRWAAAQGVQAHFIDLPLTHQLGPRPEVSDVPIDESQHSSDDSLELQEESLDSSGGVDEAVQETECDTSLECEEATEDSAWRRLCAAGGFADSEDLWDRLVETAPSSDPEALFAAVAELMEALREASPGAAPIPPAALSESTAELPARIQEARREAHMRQSIRKALKDGAERVAVVCGAWHGPALVSVAQGASVDAALLKGLPKTKVATTWVPWTYGRLSAHSGYGAGVMAPGWYHHLFAEGPHAHERWLTQAAQVMRRHRFEVSTAHVIEAVRLAEALAALRGHSTPSLAETLEAIEVVHAEGDPMPVRHVERDLLVGERMGQVPDGMPAPALARDLRDEQKRLRLKPEASSRELDLDLRKETDRERSHLLRRLRLLGIHWGKLQENYNRRSQNTFHEHWTLEWEPGFSILLVEASCYGTTVAAAARASLLEAGDKSSDILGLAMRLTEAFQANLPDALPVLLARLDALAAAGSDVPAWMSALATLAPTLRYGDVRRTDTEGLSHLLTHYADRIAIGIPAAVSGLSDEAADALLPVLVACDEGMGWLGEDSAKDWRAALGLIVRADTTHPLLAGRTVRLLLARGTLDAPGVALLLGQALSPGVAASQARWLEGLLAGGGALLLHEPELLALIDAWVQEIPSDSFDAVLPLVRRSFALMEKPERRKVGEALFTHRSPAQSSSASFDLDLQRVSRLLPTLARCLGRRVQEKA